MLDLDPKVYIPEKLLSQEKIQELVENLKKQGKKIGYCNGSWDILHPGHIAHLEAAKKLCDVLMVGVARDHYNTKKWPKTGRPIFSHNIRAYMVSKLKSVDYVFFEDGNPEEILFVKPDIYIKGEDYSDLKNPGIIAQKKIMESIRGKIVFTKTEKLSTTDIIKHIKEKIK